MSTAALPALNLFDGPTYAEPHNPGYPVAPPATLRRTCDACAASKLKCSSEKPSCSRCTKRGERCNYFIAKRGGRKPGSSKKQTKSRTESASSITTSTNTNANAVTSAQVEARTAPVSPNDWFTSSAFALNDHSLCSPDLLHQTEQQGTAIAHGMRSDLVAPQQQPDPDLFAVSMDLDTDLAELFPSPSFSTEMNDLDFFNTPNLSPLNLSNERNLSTDSFLTAFNGGFEDALSDISAPSVPSSLSSYNSIPNIGAKSTPLQHLYAAPGSSQCQCLAQVFGFMHQLSSISHKDAQSHWMRRTSGDMAVGGSLHSIQGVFAQNDTIMTALGAMIKCDCSRKDGYLLTAVSLVIFKLLGWYAAVARHTSISEGRYADSGGSHRPVSSAGSRTSHQSSPQRGHPPTTTVVRDYSLGGEESARMTAQLVLSEIHRVRRLVDDISTMLHGQASGGVNDVITSASATSGGVEDVLKDRVDVKAETELPLSALIYRQLELDLRRHLRTLSQDTIGRLKRL